jgi:drug/metabolite transporter (DMT)-like permease
MKKNQLLVIACYATLYIVWGSTYWFIRTSVGTIAVLWIMAVRWTIGGALLLGFSAARGRLRPLPSLRNLGASVALGLLLIVGGNGGVTLAEKSIDSWVAALLVACTPIVVAVFDAVLVRKRLTAARVAGVLLGCVGVAVLLYDGHSLRGTFSPSILLGIAAVSSWGLATSLGHRFPVAGDAMVSSGIQMLFVGLASLAVVLVAGPSPADAVRQVSGASLFGVLYLGVVGSIAFAAYTYLVTVEPAERVVSYALVNPVIAIVIGIVLGGEAPTPYLGAGMPLALAGLGVMLYGERLLSWLRSKLARRA